MLCFLLFCFFFLLVLFLLTADERFDIFWLFVTFEREYHMNIKNVMSIHECVQHKHGSKPERLKNTKTFKMFVFFTLISEYDTFEFALIYRKSDVCLLG